jgi:hypothetical protein
MCVVTLVHAFRRRRCVWPVYCPRIERGNTNYKPAWKLAFMRKRGRTRFSELLFCFLSDVTHTSRIVVVPL